MKIIPNSSDSKLTVGQMKECEISLSSPSYHARYNFFKSSQKSPVCSDKTRVTEVV